MTASFIPLLAVQQRSHSRIYAFPARALDNAAAVRAASLAVRNRLRGAVLALPKPERPMNVVPWPDTQQAPPTAPSVADWAPLDMLAPCSWKFLVKVAALRHGQTPKDIFERGRTSAVVKARHEAIYLVARHTIYSLARIGNKFGRDHSSVLNALSKFPPFERERLQAIAYVDSIISEIPTTERAAIIVRGFEAGVPRQEIADQIGMSIATVKRFAYVHRLKHQTRRKRGNKAANG